MIVVFLPLLLSLLPLLLLPLSSPVATTNVSFYPLTALPSRYLRKLVVVLPLVALPSCPLVMPPSHPIVILSLPCPLVVSSHRLVVALPLVAPPSCCSLTPLLSRHLTLAGCCIASCRATLSSSLPCSMIWCTQVGGVSASRWGRRGGRGGYVVAWTPWRQRRQQRLTTLTSAPSCRSPLMRQLMVHPALGGVSGEGWASLVGRLCPHTSHLDATINGVSSIVIFDGFFFVSCKTIFTTGSSKLTILAS